MFNCLAGSSQQRIFLAERAGFEPAVHLCGHTHDFQSCSFGRSDISPRKTIFFIDSRRQYNTSLHHINYWRREGDSNPRGSLWPPNRFRVDPVTTTSVPLHTLLKGRIGFYPLLLKKSTHNFPAFFPQYSFSYFDLMIQPYIMQNII